MRRQPLLALLLMLVLVGGLTLDAQPVSAAPLAGPPAGWVLAQVVGGGCDSAGHCNSHVIPGSPTLYEYKPDRQSLGRDFRVTTDLSYHGGYPTFVDREKCHIGTVDYYWSAGIWHHGGSWTLTYDGQGREQWSGPTRQHWAFAHNDICQPLPTPIPTSTPVPPPTPQPGQPTYTPSPISTDVPVPTEPPSPCLSEDSHTWEQRSNLQIGVPYVPSAEYAYNTPMDASGTPINQAYPLSYTRIPPYNLPLAVVLPGQELTLAYDLASMERSGWGIDTLAYAADHNGQAHIAFGLRDLTTGQNLLVVDTEDEKELKDINGAVIKWGRTLKIKLAVVDPRVTFLDDSSQEYSGFDRLHSGAWNPRDVKPMLNRFVAPHLARSYVQFTPQAGHTYVSWSWNGHGPCHSEAPRWTVAQFTASDGPPVTPTALVPPTPTPSPTPEPPPPPVPDASFKVSIHSTLDPNSADSDLHNAVYTSDGTMIAWPAGEVLDFTPRVQIVLNPATPSYSGYRFQAHVQNWSFVSSIGQSAATIPDSMRRAGCRGGAHQTSGASGPVCTYNYIGGSSLSDTTEPTEAQMASQAHIYWAQGTPQSMRSDVYVYNLGQLAQADLKMEVRIVVEVVNVSTGSVVASRTDTATGTFGVSLVVPRSAK